MNFGDLVLGSVGRLAGDLLEIRVPLVQQGGGWVGYSRGKVSNYTHLVNY